MYSLWSRTSGRAKNEGVQRPCVTDTRLMPGVSKDHMVLVKVWSSLCQKNHCPSSLRTVKSPPLAGIRLHPCLSLSMRLLGSQQFLGTHSLRLPFLSLGLLYTLGQSQARWTPMFPTCKRRDLCQININSAAPCGGHQPRMVAEHRDTADRN